MTDSLAGRVAIVNGASRGAGAVTAAALAAAGATVALAARDEDALSALAGEISAAGGRALALPTDIRHPLSVKRLVQWTVTAYGGLDFAVNLRGVSLAMKYEIPAMLRNGGGLIVNMGSTAGALPPEEVASAVLRLCSDEAQRRTTRSQR